MLRLLTLLRGRNEKSGPESRIPPVPAPTRLTRLGRARPGPGPARSRGYALIPGHALHEKGLQRQKGVGPLVSSQEQRALLVPRFNRGSTAGFVPPSVYIGFRLFVLLGRRGDVSSMLWRVRGRLVSWANSSVGIQSCPTPPRHPAVRSVPTRQWYVRVLDSTGFEFSNNQLIILFVDSKSRTYHGRVWAGRRTAGRRGGAWARQDGTPTDLFAQETYVLRFPGASKTTVLNDSSEARTSEIL